MAKGFSKVILLGNLTRDPETKTTPSGSTVTSFSLAVSRSVKGEDRVSFINCVAWEKGGEIIAQYTKKGNALLVSGRLDQRSYEDKDGNKRSAVEVVVDEFNFIGPKVDSNENTSAPSTSSGSKEQVVSEIPNEEINLDDIPF